MPQLCSSFTPCVINFPHSSDSQASRVISAFCKSPGLMVAKDDAREKQIGELFQMST